MNISNNGNLDSSSSFWTESAQSTTMLSSYQQSLSNNGASGSAISYSLPQPPPPSYSESSGYYNSPAGTAYYDPNGYGGAYFAYYQNQIQAVNAGYHINQQHQPTTTTYVSPQSYSMVQTTPYLQQLQVPVSVKPATPNLATTGGSYGPTSDTTPEKPVMNDSGVDLISPQLVSNHTTPLLQQLQPPLGSTQQYNQTQTSNFVQTPSTTSSNKLAFLADSTNKPETTTTKSNQNEVIEDKDNEDEDESESESSVSEDEVNSSTSSTSDKNNKENKTSTEKDSTTKLPSKPPKPYLEIIANAILSCHSRMMQLHEIYGYMESKYAYFARNVNRSWRNSVRHNLSLNECFVKAGRGTNGKGNYWEIHRLCVNEFVRGNFRRKSFKQLIRAGQASTTQAAQNGQAQRYTYPIMPADYSLSIKSISAMIPAPIPQNLSQINNNSASSYQQYNQMQQQSSNGKFEECKNSQSRYRPY